MFGQGQMQISRSSSTSVIGYRYHPGGTACEKVSSRGGGHAGEARYGLQCGGGGGQHVRVIIITTSWRWEGDGLLLQWKGSLVR